MKSWGIIVSFLHPVPGIIAGNHQYRAASERLELGTNRNRDVLFYYLKRIMRCIRVGSGTGYSVIFVVIGDGRGFTRLPVNLGNNNRERFGEYTD